MNSNRSRTGIESRLFYRLIYLSRRYARREVLPKIGASYFLTSLLSAHLSTDKRESLSLSCLERRGDSIRNVSYSTSFRWLYYRTTRFPKDFQKGILLLFSARAERDSHKRSFEFTRFLLLHRITRIEISRFRRPSRLANVCISWIFGERDFSRSKNMRAYLRLRRRSNRQRSAR